jgi:transcription initiation factor TFIIH subunit 2
MEQLASIMDFEGHASLLNSLELACDTFKRTVPPYARKEILVIFSSLITCDSGDIFGSFQKLKEMKILASVISLTAELHVLKQLSEYSQSGQFILIKNK